ncbi:hypothetical protein TorRG33x02_203120 [Trema orientale]|uniref:Uncharacterized protein n=1 Tax=Trema orientale TaxID=63057 RepID=A0A2P5EEC1_TREOI|nr:hypothetical protein TorRG33x02_203120 [Trema orientale]
MALNGRGTTDSFGSRTRMTAPTITAKVILPYGLTPVYEASKISGSISEDRLGRKFLWCKVLKNAWFMASCNSLRKCSIRTPSHAGSGSGISPKMALFAITMALNVFEYSLLVANNE